MVTRLVRVVEVAKARAVLSPVLSPKIRGRGSKPAALPLAPGARAGPEPTTPRRRRPDGISGRGRSGLAVGSVRRRVAADHLGLERRGRLDSSTDRMHLGEAGRADMRVLDLLGDPL